MDSRITILWPKISPPRIDEIRFSYDFCRRVTQNLLTQGGEPFVWVEYTTDSTVGGLRPLMSGDLVLMVSEPETIISPETVKVLAEGLEKGYAACGPLYNRTAFPEQAAALPAPYLNISTFLELARALATEAGEHTVPVNTLDPACLLYRRDILDALSPRCRIADIPVEAKRYPHNRAGVAKGALVHVSFEKSFEAERDDLVALVPPGVHSVLDIGCAMGGYGKRLKAAYPDILVTGVELNPEMAEEARRYYDSVITAPVETLELREGYDLVNCGDVLEHLRQPWEMLTHIRRHLKKGGFLVLSIPNIGHWTVVRDLLKGRFQYVPLGLLCVTHLRWFTEDSICRALDAAGFEVDTLKRDQIPPTPEGAAFIQQVCGRGLGDEQSLRTNELVIRAIKEGT